MTGPATTTSTTRRDPDWLNKGLCRDEDPELFFADGRSPTAFRQIEQAKAICRRCPSIQDCLGWALETGQDHGVWGGMSAKDRRLLTADNTQRICEACGDLLDRQGARPLCKACLAQQKAEQARQVLERRRTILDLTNKGLSSADIAKRIGVKAKTVTDDLWRIRRYGIPALTLPKASTDTTKIRRSPDMLDTNAVERAMAGKQVPLTKAERKEAVRRLHANGVSRTQIAAILRMSMKQVRLYLEADQPTEAPAVEEPAA